MNINEFLEARIAEDEAVARASTVSPWVWDDDEKSFLRSGDESVLSAYGMHTEGFIDAKPEDREHIARWNPPRVLTECAAKRAIMKRAVEASDDRSQVIDEYCVGQAEMEDAYASDPGLLIIRSLASVYADHPDYQQEWARG